MVRSSSRSAVPGCHSDAGVERDVTVGDLSRVGVGVRAGGVGVIVCGQGESGVGKPLLAQGHKAGLVDKSADGGVLLGDGEG